MVTIAARDDLAAQAIFALVAPPCSPPSCPLATTWREAGSSRARRARDASWAREHRARNITDDHQLATIHIDRSPRCNADGDGARAPRPSRKADHHLTYAIVTLQYNRLAVADSRRQAQAHGWRLRLPRACSGHTAAPPAVRATRPTSDQAHGDQAVVLVDDSRMHILLRRVHRARPTPDSQWRSRHQGARRSRSSTRAPRRSDP